LSLIEDIEKSGWVFGKDAMNSMNACMQCGKCTGSCPAGRITGYRTRRLINKVQSGDRSILEDPDIWLCTTCYTCYERCPREVKTTDIIRALRNVAVKEGYMSKSHKLVASYVAKTGHAVPINDATKKLRKKLGLSEIPPTTHKYPEALKAIQNIYKKTKFDKLIGFNWDTMNLEEK
jgi:heterodisulfide reductase subunit C